MSFSRSRKVVPELIELDSSPSTNGALVALAAIPATADFTTIVTRDQTDGRGRLGRSWVAPPGTALAISVLVRPRARGRSIPTDRFGWLPIAAGVAMTQTVADVVRSAPVGFKWPNDVLVGGRKVCGVLAELLPARAAAAEGRQPVPAGVVIGAGINVSMSESQLPVPTAISLALAGVKIDRSLEDRVLAGYLEHLTGWVSALVDAEGDADAAGLRERARALCLTLGRQVRVELPNGAQLLGTAEDLDADGRLSVRQEDGTERSVAAGDVTHVR